MLLSNGRIVQLESKSDYEAIEEWIAEVKTVIDNGGGE
jgi:hypothetical protein